MTTPDKIPYVSHFGTQGNGVSAQRGQLPIGSRKRRSKELSEGEYQKMIEYGGAHRGTALSAPFPYGVATAENRAWRRSFLANPQMALF